ncbi:hypothetical protein ACN28G_23395 [Micromonospora sp. WMMA1923]|uniref:hypothetical protein n=1 Tax=Micromonospora sp. WMMA1923 TaxID=3404125 RepID=UPI003B96031A
MADEDPTTRAVNRMVANLDPATKVALQTSMTLDGALMITQQRDVIEALDRLERADRSLAGPAGQLALTDAQIERVNARFALNSTVAKHIDTPRPIGYVAQATAQIREETDRYFAQQQSSGRQSVPGPSAGPASQQQMIAFVAGYRDPQAPTTAAAPGLMGPPPRPGSNQAQPQGRGLK